MKVLVAYYSETGNTEKVARAIFEEVSREHESKLEIVEDISPDTLNNYDLVFLGCACHSSDLAAPVKKILKELPESQKFKLAGFFTHAVWTPEQNEQGKAMFDTWASKCIDSFENISREKRIDFRGCYHCQGTPNSEIRLFIHRAITRSQEEWKAYIQEARKHPTQTDLKNAADFARSTLSMSN